MRDTLLIIDDSELDLAILNEIFKNLFRVECCSDSRRGLTFLHHNQDRICAVLLDICLGRRGVGFTVVHQLQGDPSTSGLPVILITTDANEKDVRASVERGAVDFLVKPVDPHTVQERVCNVVRSSWPEGSTILDQKNGEKAEKQKATSGADDALQPQDQEEELARCWGRRMELLCQNRPALSWEEGRKTGAIAGLLASRWAQRVPEKLSGDEAAWIGLAAPFCDIGLLGLPDQVIQGGEEQEGADGDLYARHTRLGWQLFSQEGDSPFFRYGAEIALWHHKNADGSGWPEDRGAEEIPLSAQFVRAALRIRHYLRYYQGLGDAFERMLRAIKNEEGILLTSAALQAVEWTGEDLRTLCRHL